MVLCFPIIQDTLGKNTGTRVTKVSSHKHCAPLKEIGKAYFKINFKMFRLHSYCVLILPLVYHSSYFPKMLLTDGLKEYLSQVVVVQVFNPNTLEAEGD